METMHCFTIGQFYQWEFVTDTIGIFRQTNQGQEAIRVSTGELKVVSYKNSSDVIKIKDNRIRH